MKDDIKTIATILSNEAEKLLKIKFNDVPLPVVEKLNLIHELEVLQIELEMQNEELEKKKDDLKAGKDLPEIRPVYIPVYMIFHHWVIMH